MAKKAHLCVKLELVGERYEVVGFGVYSAPALNLTCVGFEMYADIWDMDGDSFDDARKKLLEALPKFMPSIARILEEEGEV